MMSSLISSLMLAAVICECFGFRGGPAHLGTYDSSPPTLGAVKWRFSTKGKILSSPLVVGGTVYVGSSDGNLYAVDAAGGTENWAFETKGPVTSSPAYADGIVYVASLDGFVYALDARSGSARWKFATKGERRFTAPGIHGIAPSTEVMPDPYDLFISSPAVYGGTVYVGSGDHNVYALDAMTGVLRWKYATGNVVHASPAVADGTVYVGSWDRYFYALDARTGKVRWRFLTGNDTHIYNQVGINSSAAVEGDTVYFGCRDSHLYALDRRSGRLRWSHDEHGSWVISSPAVSGGSVFYTTSDEVKFFALDARTGTERFRVSQRAFSFSSPAVAGNMVYFGTFDGRLYEVDARTGSIVKTFATDASARNASAHFDSGGNLRLRDFYPDDTLDGTIVGLSRIFELGSIVSSPAIAGGVLFVGSSDGKLYAVT